MNTGLKAIEAGTATPTEAWTTISPLLNQNDRPFDALNVYHALRSFTWKALDGRRRDDDLRRWIDVMNRADAFASDRHPEIGAKIAVLAELLHESIAVASIAAAVGGKRHDTMETA